jgi:hypothetical protein
MRTQSKCIADESADDAARRAITNVRFGHSLAHFESAS